ncbi:MAG TPA: IS1380 family transposase [Actinoplanes sp.]|nr:IS1380 family transposase [Actinoplanes sp.]
MQLSHAASGVSAVFDDPNLVSCGGLAPAVALAERAGLADLVASRLTLPGGGGGNAAVKVPGLVAGMVAGADSIADMDLLRHGGMGRLFDGVRAPSTLGTFLRSFTFGHVRQLDAVASRFLARLATATPLLPGAEAVAFVDVDDTIRETHGYAKQGAGYGYSGVKGLNALLATISTPTAAPVIAATRLRRGSVNSARGAARLVADALACAKAAGAGGLLIVRADSAYYTHDVIAAARRAGARFSVTARMTKTVTAAIGSIPADRWTTIRYPQAIWDDDEQRWISDAEIAEVPLTAFTGRRKADHICARLIVRRVRRLNPDTAPASHGEQGELFAAWRYHAAFTDSPLPIREAEAAHRGHAVIEQVIADLKNSALAHLPSGKFTANAAWLALAAVAFNLTRAAGAAASAFHARATTATIRRQLITVPARLARSGRRLTLHLPTDWPWQAPWQALFTAASTGPPVA